MNSMTIIGIILAVLGLVGLIYGGITYTSSDNVLDVGGLHVKVDQKNRFPISPIAGAAALIIGGTLIVAGRKKGRGSAV